MPHADPSPPRLTVTGPPSDGGLPASNATVTSVDAFEASYRTFNTEDARSPVTARDEDLHTAITAPLLTITNADRVEVVARNTSGYSLTSRAPSPQPGTLSPFANTSVCVPPHNHNHLSSSGNDQYLHHRWSAAQRDDAYSGDGSRSDLFSAPSLPAASIAPRSVDNFSFASAEHNGTTRPRHDVAPDTPRTPTTTIRADPPSPSILHRLLSVILPSLHAFRERIHNMTWKRILWVALLVALVMVGNFMQIVMLNFWLISFPADGTPGNYTAFAVPGIFFAILFALLFGAYVVIRRPSLRFATHLHGWGILLGVGFTDAFNSWMATYAASNTSEVLQALFTNLCPLYAVFLSKWILHDTRRYANVYIASVFILTICGILAASLYGLIKDHNVSEGKWWILIFFLSMPVRVLMNVWQSLYMIVYTRDPKFVSWLRVRFAEEAPVDVHVGDGPRDSHDGAAHTPTTMAEKADFATPVDSLEGDASTPRFADGDGVHKARTTTRANHVDAVVESDEVNSAHTAVRATTATTADVTAKGVSRKTAAHASTTHKLATDAVVDVDAEEEEEEEGRDAADMPIAASDIVLHDGHEGCDSVDTAAARRASTLGVVGHDADEQSAGAAGGDDDDEDVLSPTAAAAPPLPTQTMFTVRYNQGEDTIVKLVMLAGETFIQMCFTLSLLPADALPWWGNSDTVEQTWDNFKEGIRCVFTIQENFLYCFLYTLGFVFTYVGCAYLNHYSAALCSIVSQLSSPVTALMLVIVPSWNVQEDGDSPWYCNVVAIVFLCIAALLYVLWEEMTDHEKVQAEYALKMEQLHVRPSSHEAPHPVVMDG